MSGTTQAAAPHTSTLSELTASLRQLFWLVHPIRSWAAINPPEAPAPRKPSPLLASAPFFDWREVVRRIQIDIKPEAWTIEKKSLTEESGLLILLRKNHETFAIEILPLRSYQTACFYHDFSRGNYLKRLLPTVNANSLPQTQSQTQGTHLAITPAGLFWTQTLVLSNLSGLTKFFGIPKPANPTPIPKAFYAEIAGSPFFNPKTFFILKEESDPKAPTTASPPIQAFQNWWKTQEPSSFKPPAPVSYRQLRDRIELIRSES